MRVFKGIDVLVEVIVAAAAHLWLNVSGIRLVGDSTRRIGLLNHGHILLGSRGSPGDGSASRGQFAAMHIITTLPPLCLKPRSKSDLLGVAGKTDETVNKEGVFAPQKVGSYCCFVENCSKNELVCDSVDGVPCGDRKKNWWFRIGLPLVVIWGRALMVVAGGMGLVVADP